MRARPLALYCLALLTALAPAQESKPPTPDLVRQPLVAADVAELPKGTERLDIFLLMGAGRLSRGS